MYWGINYNCSVSRSVSRYIVHVLHRFLVAVGEVKMSRQTTLGPFGFTKKHFSQKYRDGNGSTRLKTYNCIVFKDFQHKKLYPFQNLSLEFILKIDLRSGVLFSEERERKANLSEGGKGGVPITHHVEFLN